MYGTNAERTGPAEELLTVAFRAQLVGPGLEDGAAAYRRWEAVSVVDPRLCPRFFLSGSVSELSRDMQTQSPLSP